MKPVRVPHETKRIKGLPWLVCRYCGLVYLRNDLTRRAISAGCER